MKTETKTQTVTEFVITLTEAELTEALIDPAPLQATLRTLRAAQHKGKHGRKNLTFVRKPSKHAQARAAKAAAKEKPAGPKAPAGKGASPAICPDCRKGFKSPHALRIHQARGHKPQVESAADAAKSSESR